MSVNISTIEFFSDSIIAIEKDDEIYIPLKRICENLDVVWSGQLTKIKTDPVLLPNLIELSVYTEGGNQLMSCLPLKYMYGWLMKMNPSKVSPHVRDKLINYQELIYDVIYKHFHPTSNKSLDATPEVLKHLADFAISHGNEIVSIKKDFLVFEKDVVAAFNHVRQEIFEINKKLSIEIAVLRKTVEMQYEQYRVNAYEQATQITQSIARLPAQIKYMTIKETRFDENLKDRVAAYSKRFGYYTLSNRLIKWAAARGCEIKKTGGVNLYPYQMILDFFDPIHNKELTNYIDFSKFKEYKKS